MYIIPFHIHHHVSEIDQVLSELAELKTLIQQLLKGMNNMTPQMQRLVDDVAKTRTLEDSAVQLMQGLSQQLRDAIASGDDAQASALADQLEAGATAMAQAITANTPAASAAQPPQIPVTAEANASTGTTVGPVSTAGPVSGGTSGETK